MKKKVREGLGELPITQIRDTLQLSVTGNKNDYVYAYDISKEVLQKQSKRKNSTFQQLFPDLNTLTKNFDEKNKL